MEESVLDPRQCDEDLQFGTRIDYEDIDDPRKWQLVQDPSNKPKQKAVKIRRMLAGPRYMESVWVPVIKKDDDGKEFAGYFKIRKDYHSRNTLLDAMRASEASAKQKATGSDSDRMQFDPEEAWCYLVLCREDDVPRVRLAFYKPSIMKAIKTKQHDEHPTKPGFLLNGPAVCSDIIITKWFDPREKGLKKTSYAVEWMPDNPFAGKVPISFWTTGFKFQEGKNFVNTGIFSEADWDAVQAFLKEHDVKTVNQYLDSVVAPQTDADVRRLLSECPLNQWAKNKDGAIFPNPELFMLELAKLSVPCLAAPKEFETREEPPQEKMPVPDADEPLPEPPDAPKAAAAPKTADAPKQTKKNDPFADHAPSELPNKADAGGAW